MSKILSLALVLVVLTPTFIFSTISGNAMINNSTSENSTTTAPTRREAKRTSNLSGSNFSTSNSRTNRLIRNASAKPTVAKKPIKKANSKKLSNSTIAQQATPKLPICTPDHAKGDVYLIGDIKYRVTRTDRLINDAGAESKKRCVVEVMYCNNNKPAIDMNRSAMNNRVIKGC